MTQHFCCKRKIQEVTWKEIETPRLDNIKFVDSLYGIGGGPDGIFYTNDGGENWNKCDYPEIESGIFRVSKILFINSKIGWILLQPGFSFEGYLYVLKTEDSGLTWTKTLNDLTLGASDLFALDSLNSSLLVQSLLYYFLMMVEIIG